ncbi:peroxiredoxin [Streptomyces sp. CB09001]|uniref:OsmC family peroxiredoxin n=1 Tax=unclassified Streptomyces TaxID=2593676 RepID=UPI000E212567|nr:OsmC family peroxiredoxin [Streptomyces sp. CB09001]AXL87132.1 peroxiredoxin [Streptomyces sp. CB09001]
MSTEHRGTPYPGTARPPTRTARIAWEGDLEGGSGQVTLESSRVATHPISYYERTAQDAGGTTSPEELLAAAHTTSYVMALSAVVAQSGGTPESLDVSEDVSLAPDPAGGFRLAGLTLTVRGRVAGLDADGFAEAARRAAGTDPFGKALAAVQITVHAELEP